MTMDEFVTKTHTQTDSIDGSLLKFEVVVVVVDVVVDVSVQSRGHKTEAHQRDRDTNKKTMDKITKINHPKFH